MRGVLHFLMMRNFSVSDAKIYCVTKSYLDFTQVAFILEYPNRRTTLRATDSRYPQTVFWLTSGFSGTSGYRSRQKILSVHAADDFLSHAKKPFEDISNLWPVKWSSDLGILK